MPEPWEEDPIVLPAPQAAVAEEEAVAGPWENDPVVLPAEQAPAFNPREGLHGPALKKRLDLEAAADKKFYQMQREKELADEMAFKYEKMTPGARLFASGMAQVFPTLQAGVARVIGESDTADEAIRQGQAIERGSAQVDPSFGAGLVRGATRSLGLAGVTAPLGLTGASIALGGAALNQGLTDATDAGLTGWDRLDYAGRAGIIEAAVNRIIPGGIEGQVFTKELLKNLGKNFLNEAREEVAIELLNAVNEAASGVDPDATDPATLAKRVAATVLQTGMVVGGAKGISKLTATEEAAPINPELPAKAVQWAQQNPEAARKIMETGSISRKQAAAMGVDRSSATEREAMLSAIEQSMVESTSGETELPETPQDVLEQQYNDGNVYGMDVVPAVQPEAEPDVAPLVEEEADVGTDIPLSEMAEKQRVRDILKQQDNSELGREGRRATLDVPAEPEGTTAIDKVLALRDKLGRMPVKDEVAKALLINREQAGFLLRKAKQEVGPVAQEPSVQAPVSNAVAGQQPATAVIKTKRQRLASPEEVGIERLRKKGWTDEDIADARAEGLFAKDEVTEFNEARAGKARQDTVQRALKHVADTDEDATYAEMDLRNLGGLNEKLGHEGANAVFKEFGTAIREELAAVLPDSDVHLFRHGGDELSAVVANADESKVNSALERAAARIQEIAERRGLSKIRNPKRPFESGTGIHYGTQAIEAGLKPERIFSLADRKVELRKKAASPVKVFKLSEYAKGNVDVNREQTETSGAAAPEGQAAGTSGSVGEGNRGRRGGNKAPARSETGTQSGKTEKDLLKEADENTVDGSLGSMGGNLLAGRVTDYGDSKNDPVAAPKPEIEARLQKAHGLKKDSWITKIKDVAKAALNKSTRAQEFIPNNEKFAAANENLRLLKAVPEAASDQTNRVLAAVLDPLDANQKAIFERYLVLRNLEKAVEKDQPLRFGFENIEQVKQYRQKLEKIIEGDALLKKAVESNQAAISSLVKEAIEFGVLPEGTDPEWYYHQQVLEKMLLDSHTTGAGVKPIKRSFQKGRITGVDSLDERFDYNTDYIEASATWMTEARIEIEKEKILRDVNRIYGKAIGEDGEIPDGYAAWQPEPGNYFYRAVSPTEKIVEDIQRSLFKDMVLSPKLKEIVALGGPRRTMILPKEIVQQFVSMDKPKADNAVRDAAKQAQSWWKAWMTQAPHRILGYTLRNVTGDLDAAIGGAPGVLKYVPKSADELWSYYSNKKLSMSDDLKMARDLGVLSASESAREIPDLKDLALFKRYYGKMSTLKKAYSETKKLQMFREGALRFAAFKYFKSELEAGTLKDYGGAKKEVVDALVKDMGVDVAAAHLSRNLLGDYGNLTVLGNWMRSYLVPFWSYQEINAKRYPRMIINALKNKGDGVQAAAIGAIALGRLAALSGMFWAWNNLFMRDEEEDLGRFDRQNPHLNLGRYADGSVRVLRNTGALGDAMEWLGLNTLISKYQDFKKGRVTAEDLLIEMAKDPINKIVQGLRPDAKGLAEVFTGQTYFPDAMNPRRVDRDEAAANVVGVAEELKAFKGKVLRDGSSMKANYGWRWLGFGSSDPRRNALYDMYAKRDQFKPKEDEALPRSKFKDIRESAMNDDFQAFKDARRVYMEKGNGFKNFIASLQYIDPIAKHLKDADEKKFEREFLNEEERLKLKIARDYAGELKLKLWSWWNKAAEEDSPESQKEFKGQREEFTNSRLRVLTSPFPLKAEKGKTFAETRDEYKAQTAAALEDLKASGLSKKEILTQWRRYVYKEFKSDAAREARMMAAAKKLGKL